MAPGPEKESTSAPPNRLTWRKRAVFFVLMAVMTLLLCEGLLWGLAAAFPGVRAVLSPDPQWIMAAAPDARLGYRPNPAHPEHDCRGFRNPAGVDRCRILVLGDSQTYGTGVLPEEAWPGRLEALSGERVYNAAFGGWGPAEHYLLWDELRALEPDLVIQAFYDGNDLYDAFAAVYERGVPGQFASGDPEILRQVESLRTSDPLAAKVARTSWVKPIVPEGEVSEQTGGDQASQPGVRYFLSQYSKLYGLLRAVRRTVWPEEADRAVELLYSPSLREDDALWSRLKDFAQREAPEAIFETDRLRTLLSADYRLIALDSDDVRIREGLRISLEAIAALNRSARSRGAAHVVVLIPTKELVFRDAVFQHLGDRAPETFRKLVENEQRVREQMKSYLDGEGIPWIDPLPAMRQCLEKGAQPYRITRDGHPNPTGHRAIAESVLSGLRSQGLLSRASPPAVVPRRESPILNQ